MQLEFGGRRYAVAAADVLIGSGPDSTLLLQAPGVLPRHAVVRALADGMAVVVPAEPGAEILVNGARLGGDPIPLMHGDKIRIGGQELTVADPRRAGATRVVSAAPSGPALPAARLVSLSDGREYPLGADGVAIGRDASCTVVVLEDAVSRRHAEIHRTPEGDRLADQSGNGTFVNGQRIRGEKLLAGGDLIRVGATELRYYRVDRAPKAPAPPPSLAPVLAVLLVRSGQLLGQRIAVRTPVTNIGRADYNDVKLPDLSLSAGHAKLQLREGVWMLSDLGSTNGSTVDGEPVAGETPLSPGATITLGEVRLFFEPYDTGIRKVGSTRVLEPPPAPAPVAPAVPARSRQPVAAPPPRRRRVLLAGLVMIAALLLAGYYYFFLR